MSKRHIDSGDHLENLAGSGVDALVQRLRDEGVEAGRREAQRLIQQAKQEAESIISDAQAQKNRMLEEARQDAHELSDGGKEALRIAARDSILKLKHQILNLFSEQLHDKISASLQETDLLRRMITQIAAKTRDELDIDPAESMEILISEISLDARSLRADPMDLDRDPLVMLALDAIRDTLNPGIHLSLTKDKFHGIRIALKDRGIEIDLSDEGVTALLLAHLQPRFKAILDGFAI
ncbi:MAG: hypothetical protein ACPW60_08915 [Methylohalobius sp. ZOD2]